MHAAALKIGQNDRVDSATNILEGPLSPYMRFEREQWARLVERTPLPLTQDDVDRIASFGDPIDMREVEAIYRPLSALLQLYVDGRRRTTRERRAFLSIPGAPAEPDTPFIIGVAGSVAVGKSTVARLLQLLLSRWETTPRVDLVTTDGFLLPNAVLEERGIMARKGFPQSYDRQALIDFLAAVKGGHKCVEAPVYSHLFYDIVPGESIRVSRPTSSSLRGSMSCSLRAFTLGLRACQCRTSSIFPSTLMLMRPTLNSGMSTVSLPSAIPPSAVKDPSSVPTPPSVTRKPRQPLE